MKKINKLILLLILILLPHSIKALEVSNNNITLTKGNSKNIELYANVEEEVKSLKFTLTFTTYDIPAYYSPSEGTTDSTPNSITHNLTFNENKTGRIYLGNIVISAKQNYTDTTGIININNAKYTNINDEEILLDSQDINVTITEEIITEKDYNLLDKIESKLVTITLEKDKFEYEIEIPSTTKELDLKAIPKEESTSIDISSQVIDQNKDNEIIITTKNDNIEQKYTIKIKLIEQVKNEIKVDLEETSTNNINYNSKWIIIIIVMSIILVIGLIFNRKK